MTETTETAPRPLRADARRNRELLLDAAIQVFGDDGVDASLEEVARRAGVGVGTLYRHFPTRNALVEALVREDSDALCRYGDQLVAEDPEGGGAGKDRDPVEALASWLRALVDHASRFRGLAQSLTAAATERCDADDPLADCCHSVEATARALVDRVRQAGRLRPQVHDNDVVDLAAAVAWIGEYSPDDTDQRDRLLSLVVDAVCLPADG
jgi:AcrR family transcriptional regulator